MDKKNIFKKILFALAIVILVVFVFYAYKIIGNRYFNSTKKEATNNQSENASNNISSQNPNSENIQLENQQEEIDSELKKMETEEKTEEEKSQVKVDEDEPFVDISKEDCRNNCKNYSAKDELSYCQETCGLNSQKSNSDCDESEGLEKDYCFKNLAISKKDFKICNQIQDAGIKKTCTNRITEDILDSQK